MLVSTTVIIMAGTLGALSGGGAVYGLEEVRYSGLKNDVAKLEIKVERLETELNSYKTISGETVYIKMNKRDLELLKMKLQFGNKFMVGE